MIPWVRAKATITTGHYKTLSSYAAMRDMKERDYHTPLVTILDSEVAYSHHHVHLQRHAGTLAVAENVSFGRYNTWTESYMMSTPWKPPEECDHITDDGEPYDPWIVSAGNVAISIRTHHSVVTWPLVNLVMAFDGVWKLLVARLIEEAHGFLGSWKELFLSFRGGEQHPTQPAVPAPAEGGLGMGGEAPQETTENLEADGPGPILQEEPTGSEHAPPPLETITPAGEEAPVPTEPDQPCVRTYPFGTPLPDDSLVEVNMLVPGVGNIIRFRPGVSPPDLSQAPPPPPPPPGLPPPPVTPSPPPFSRRAKRTNRMQKYWEFVDENNNMLPQLTSVCCPQPVLERLLKGPLDQVGEHIRRALLDGQDCTALVPPKGMTATAVADRTAIACGPVLTTPLVHNTADRCHANTAAEVRFLPEVNPKTGKPYKFDKSTSTAARYMTFWNKVETSVFTRQRIHESYNALYGSKDFHEIHMSKFSPEDIKRAQELIETAMPQKFNTRKANAKKELVEKDAKAARFVVDNGIELLALCQVFVKVYQDLIYGKERGVFHEMSIKEQAREEALDKFGSTFSNPTGPEGPRCGWEIDQTGMEKHERMDKKGDGALGPVYKILQKICTTLKDKMNGRFGAFYDAKIQWDKENGMRIKLTMKGEHLAKPRTIMVKFSDMYMDSGWGNTSGGNYGNEVAATMSSTTLNPEHLLAWDKAEKCFRLQNGTFDWKFKSIPLEHPPDENGTVVVKSKDIHMRGKYEGDDGGGQTDALFALENNRDAVVQNMADIGFCAKLKTVITGRVEIIGAHFVFKDGATDRAYPWVPALQRCIGKIGAQVGTNITPASTVARFLSIGCAFAGRLPPVADCFFNSAKRDIARFGSQILEQQVRVQEYDDVNRWADLEPGLHTLCKVFNATITKACRPGPCSATQVRLANNSVAENVNATVIKPEEWANMGLLAEQLLEPPAMITDANGTTRALWDHQAAFALLPEALA